MIFLQRNFDKSMKAALNIESFSLSKGGGGGYASNFADQLLKNGYEVHIFSSSFESELADINPHKVSIIRIPKTLRGLSFAINSKKLIGQYDFDIVFGFGGTLYVDIYRPGGGTEKGYFLQNLKSIDNKFIRTLSLILSRIDPKTSISFYIDYKIYKSNRLKLVIANSNMVRKDIIKHHNLPENRIKVVYNGVDLDRFNTSNRQIFRKEIRKIYDIDDREILILFMANNFRLKGLYCLIRATALLKKTIREPFKLVVVGKGKFKKKYIKLAKISGCERNLVFTGKVDRPERFYAAADIFVHPTFYDPFANVCLEALASGLPVITTSYNGAGEIITDRVDGFVVKDPREISILAEKIAFFFNASNRIKAGEDARRLAESFSREKNYSKILKAIKQVQ